MTVRPPMRAPLAVQGLLSLPVGALTSPRIGTPSGCGPRSMEHTHHLRSRRRCPEGFGTVRREAREHHRPRCSRQLRAPICRPEVCCCTPFQAWAQPCSLPWLRLIMEVVCRVTGPVYRLHQRGESFGIGSSHFLVRDRPSCSSSANPIDSSHRSLDFSF